MLPVAAGQNSGAPSAVGAADADDGGQRLVFDRDRSSASLAASAVSATTAATASPTKRTTSTASAGRSGDAPGEPSGRWNIGASGIGFTPAAASSAPV